MSELTVPIGNRPPPQATAPAPGPAPATWWQRLGRPRPRLNLALQGGGAHGAFTWGVLQALLDDHRIEFEGISGSSAGAMNAVVLADGWMKGGRDGAREGLTRFWTAVGQQLPPAMVSQGLSDSIDLSPASKLLAGWAGYFSPSQLNPFDLNPLRQLVAGLIDFERLRTASPFKLFVGTTQASSGQLRVFREHELTVDVLLASACLPKIHHAIEIDGQPYWDGGYSANPAVFPLFYGCDSRDVLLVLLSPTHRAGSLRTVEEIEARIAELGFSAHFMREMRTFTQATAYSQRGFVLRGRLERRLHQMRFHLVDADDLAPMRRSETKILAYGPFLERLREHGRERAAHWLAAQGAAVGQRSSVDLAARFG